MSPGTNLPSDSEPRYLEPLLGIVFDLDGTLIVSRHDFTRMRKEVIRAAERYGVVPGHLSITEPIHRILETARAELSSDDRPQGVVYRFDAEVNHVIDAIELEALPRTIPRPGAEPLLKGLTQRGFRVGLLTRSSERFCRAALGRTGLAPYFPYLRTRSAPGPAKPSPESLLALLNEMGIPVGRALYVGDHLIDAECATRAGVRFYAVLPEPGEPNPMTSDRFLAGGAAAVASDLSDLARQLNIAVPAANPRPAT